MVSRKLWIPREELVADRTAQAQKMLGDAFKGVRGGLEDAASQTRDLFTQQREEWARKQLEEEMARARQQAEAAAAQAEQQRQEQERQAAEAQAQQQTQASQVTGAQNGFLQGKLAPTPGVDIPEDGTVTLPTPGVDGQAKRMGLDGLRDQVGGAFDAIRTRATETAETAPAGRTEGILPEDIKAKARAITPDSLTAPTGLLGTEGPLIGAAKTAAKVPGLSQALGGPAFAVPGLQGGQSTLSRAGVRTARDWVDSVGTIQEGTEKLGRGDVGGAALDIGMGTIGAVSPQFTALGNIAAEQALDAGANEEEAQAIGNVVGFFTPGGGIQQIGKAGAFLKGARGTGAIATAGGAAERLARGTGNLFESADDIAKGGALRALGPAGVAGVAAPIGGAMGYRQAQEEGADAQSTALRTLGGAAAAADIGAGVSDMGLGALTGAGRMARSLPGRTMAAGAALRESTAVDGRAGITPGQDGQVRRGPSRALKIDAAGELVGGLAGAQVAGEQLTEEDDPWQKKAAAGAAGFVAGAGLGSQVRRNANLLGRVGKAFATGEAAPGGAPRERIIPPKVARGLTVNPQPNDIEFGRRSGFMPNRLDIAHSIRNTKGARVFPDGTLELNLWRYGKPRRELGETGRGGVFYAATKEQADSYLSADQAAEGGQTLYKGPTAFRNVLFVDETGSMGRDIGSSFLGKAGYEATERELDRLLSRGDDASLQQATAQFQELGWAPDEAGKITASLRDQRSRHGTSYALPESIGSGLLRSRGYEAAVGVQRADAGPHARLGEVFEVRESAYPGQGPDDYRVQPEFTGERPRSLVPGKPVDPALKQIGRAAQEGRLPAGMDSKEAASDQAVLEHLGLDRWGYEGLPQQAKMALDRYLFEEDADRSVPLPDLVQKLLNTKGGAKTQRWSSEAAYEGQKPSGVSSQAYKKALKAPTGNEQYLGNIDTYAEPKMVNYNPTTGKYVVVDPKTGEDVENSSYYSAELKLLKYHPGLQPGDVPKPDDLTDKAAALKAQAPAPKAAVVPNYKGLMAAVNAAEAKAPKAPEKPGILMPPEAQQITEKQQFMAPYPEGQIFLAQNGITWYIKDSSGAEPETGYGYAFSPTDALEQSAKITGGAPLTGLPEAPEAPVAAGDGSGVDDLFTPQEKLFGAVSVADADEFKEVASLHPPGMVFHNAATGDFYLSDSNGPENAMSFPLKTKEEALHAAWKLKHGKWDTADFAKDPDYVEVPIEEQPWLADVKGSAGTGMHTVSDSLDMVEEWDTYALGDVVHNTQSGTYLVKTSDDPNDAWEYDNQQNALDNAEVWKATEDTDEGIEVEGDYDDVEPDVHIDSGSEMAQVMKDGLGSGSLVQNHGPGDAFYLVVGPGSQDYYGYDTYVEAVAAKNEYFPTQATETQKPWAGSGMQYVQTTDQMAQEWADFAPNDVIHNAEDAGYYVKIGAHPHTMAPYFEDKAGALAHANEMKKLDEEDSLAAAAQALAPDAESVLTPDGSVADHAEWAAVKDEYAAGDIVSHQDTGGYYVKGPGKMYYEASTPGEAKQYQDKALAKQQQAEKKPGIIQKLGAAAKTLLSDEEGSATVGIVKGSSPFNQGEAPRQGDPDKRPRRVAPPTPSAGERQFGTPEVGPGERQVGATQRPRPGEVDRRVQGTHKGGPMGQQKQVVEETPGELDWKPGDPLPDPDDLAAQGISPTGQQAYDIARQESDEIAAVQKFITDAALEGVDVPPGLRAVLKSMRQRQGVRAQRLREAAEALPGTAGQLARDSKAEASRISKTKAGQAARQARVDALLKTGDGGQGTGDGSTVEEPSTAVDEGPITDAEGRAVASTGPDQVDLDGKPVEGAETVPEAVSKEAGVPKPGRMPKVPVPPGATPSVKVSRQVNRATRGLAQAGQTPAPTGTAPPGTPKPPTPRTPRGTTTGPPTPPKTPPTPAPKTPKPEMARFGWLDENGKLRRMGDLEEAFRKQELDDHKAWETYQQELKAAKGDQRVGAQATAKYESLVRKRTAKRAQEIGTLTEDEVLELASHAGPNSEDIRKLIKKADVEMKGMRPDFVGRDNFTNLARLNLIGGNTITIARNALGGVTNLFWHPLESAVASGIDPALAKYYKHKGLDERIERRYGKETTYLFKGYARSLGAALTNAGHAVREGNAWTAQGLAEKLKAERTGSAMAGRVAGFTDKVFTPLTATDAFFRTLTQGGELFRQQYRTMKKAGLSDAQIDKEITSLLQAPRDKFVERMSSELAVSNLEKGVAEQAHYRAFTQSLDSPGRALQWVQQQPGIGPMLMPFITTPYNAAKFDLERSPAGALKQLGELATLRPKADMEKIASSGEMSDRLARGLIGSGLFGFLALGGVSGLIDLNGKMPESQGERDEWEAEGRRPYSIRIGDRYVSFQDLPGLNAALVSAAVVQDLIAEGKTDSPDYFTAVAKGVLDATMSLAAKPMAGGVVELVAAGLQPSRAASWARGAFTPAMPAAGMLRTWGTALDPMQREQPASFTEELQSVYRILPGVNDLPTRRTAVGDEMENFNAGLPGLANPLRTSAADRFRVPTRHVTTGSAKEDLAYSRAAEKVNAWKRNPNLPMPSDQDFVNAALSTAAKDPYTAYLRETEAARLQEQNAGRK